MAIIDNCANVRRTIDYSWARDAICISKIVFRLQRLRFADDNIDSNYLKSQRIGYVGKWRRCHLHYTDKCIVVTPRIVCSAPCALIFRVGIYYIYLPLRIGRRINCGTYTHLSVQCLLIEIVLYGGTDDRICCQRRHLVHSRCCPSRRSPRMNSCTRKSLASHSGTAQSRSTKTHTHTHERPWPRK